MTTATRPIAVSYAQRSELRHGPPGTETEVLLALDSGRGAVGIRGQVSDAGLLRDALLTATAVLGSDLRYRGRDRTAYLAYLAKKGKRTTAAIWEAQKAFLDESLAADEQPTAVLPPVLTVHPDEVALEVFSRDESAYARLSLSSALFNERQAAHGTSYVDLPPALVEELDRLRGGQKVRLEAGVALPRPTAHGAHGAPPSPYEQALKVPLGALRSFLQVQTAATLPAVACELMPIDLYNLLFALRTRKAKKSPRALRFELIPGTAPRLILEPWDLVLEGHGAPFRGPGPVVVRTFGRQRLLLLARLLPHVRRARALLLGPGLPAFWVLDLGLATLTLALTGWTESGWASAASFDALMPGAGADKRADAVEALLLSRGPLTAQQILDEQKAGAAAAAEEVRGALKLLALRGKVLFDVAGGTYRPRQLLAEPLDIEDIRYGSTAEARAHRLLSGGTAGEVRLTKLHEIVGEGVEIHGEITDREARRSYVTRYTLDTEGRVKEASCTCPHFRRSGLREGPCEHLLALRVLTARRRAEEEALRQTPEGRKLIRAETRTLLRRELPEHGGQEVVYRVSLDQRAVRLAWGPRTGPQRQQRLWFDSDREAREAYFSRLEQLAAEGFIDAGSLTA
jgi:hypothetical protein